MDPVAYFVTLAEGVTPLIYFVAAAIDAVHDWCWSRTRSADVTPVILFGNQVAACKVFNTPISVAPDVIPLEIDSLGVSSFGEETEDTVLVDLVLLDDDVATLRGVSHQIDTCIVIGGNIVVFDVEPPITIAASIRIGGEIGQGACA